MGADKTITYLIPDANLFIQCRPLGELNRALWKDRDEVQLVVTRPVQREIDSQKSSGKGRVNTRARKTASLFRDIVVGDDQLLVIRERKPRMTLRIRPEFQPDPALSDELDYGPPSAGQR